MAEFLDATGLSRAMQKVDARLKAIAATIADGILNDESFKTVLLQHITELVASMTFSLMAPDGNSIATNDSGVLTVQAATNTKFGIVKGQPNNSPTTWHQVSADNGLLSVNRELLETLVDQKIINAIDEIDCTGSGTLTEADITKILNMITLLAPDGSVIAKNNGGTLTLQRANPYQFGIVRCCHSCACYPKLSVTLQSMDGLLVADVQDSTNIYFPMVFRDESEEGYDYFGKWTFTTKNMIDITLG